MRKIQHEDKCRWWDDNEFCDCGAVEVDRLEKEVERLNAERDNLKAALERIASMTSFSERGCLAGIVAKDALL